MREREGYVPFGLGGSVMVKEGTENGLVYEWP